MGVTPLSTPITIRGKSVLGKTDTGIEKARYAPTTASAIVENKIGREKRSNQGAAAFSVLDTAGRRTPPTPYPSPEVRLPLLVRLPVCLRCRNLLCLPRKALQFRWQCHPEPRTPPRQSPNHPR